VSHELAQYTYIHWKMAYALCQYKPCKKVEQESEQLEISQCFQGIESGIGGM